MKEQLSKNRQISIDRQQTQKVVPEEKNVILCSMSLFNTYLSTNAYYLLDKKEQYLFSGISQLEPGSKYFINKLAAEGKRIDQIIVYCSPKSMVAEAKNLPNSGGKDSQITI